MRTLLAVVALLGTLLVSVGCATGPHVETDWDTRVLFSEWRSWAWAPQPAGEAAASLHDARIRRSVESVLGERGFTETDAREADFLLAYHTTVSDRTDVVLWDEPAWGYHFRRDWRPLHSTTVHYRVGTLVLDVIGRRAANVAWRGWAEAELQEDRTPEERDRLVDQAVRKILADFPPADAE